MNETELEIQKALGLTIHHRGKITEWSDKSYHTDSFVILVDFPDGHSPHDVLRKYFSSKPDIYVNTVMVCSHILSKLHDIPFVQMTLLYPKDYVHLL